MSIRIVFTCLLCSVLGALAPALGATERAETLRAINWVENPTNHTRRGPKGELGPYQFRAQTWRLHTSRPFSLAIVREHADAVAIKHYEWIKQGLIEAGIEPSAYNIALAWNSGLGAVQRGRVPTVSYNYAERVANLVDVQLRRHLAPAAVVASVAQPLAPTVEPLLSFSSAPSAPRFVVDLLPEPLYEPAVVGELPTVVAAAPLPTAVPATIPVIKVDENAFTLVSAAAPRFALIK